MSDPRDAILARVRRALAVTGEENDRRLTVQRRLHSHPSGLVPARAELTGKARLDLFRTRLEAEYATIATAGEAAGIPALVADYLAAHNLASEVTTGADPFLAALPFPALPRDGVPAIARTSSAIATDMTIALSKAVAGAAETGTLFLASGRDNPTSLNFLPETHIVVIEAKDVFGSFEAAWNRLRELYGHRTLPRAINLISGPSRTADIEQTIIMGAHGPRRLHVIIVG